MTILLVDHAETEAALLASALRVDGFDVVVALTARSAHEILRTQPISLAIVDLMLKSEAGANGLELARDLRRAHPAMRVFLTSSYHLSERQLERADCGVSGFIPKPYDLGEVTDFVRAKLSGPPSSRRLWCAEAGSGITRAPELAPTSASFRTAAVLEPLAGTAVPGPTRR